MQWMNVKRKLEFLRRELSLHPRLLNADTVEDAATDDQICTAAFYQQAAIGHARVPIILFEFYGQESAEIAGFDIDSSMRC